MISSTRALALTAALALCAQTTDAKAPPPKPLAATQVAPRVQLALLLDNSGSMQGLINQARSELWTIVNALAEAEKNGQHATLEVALYSYGDPPARQLVPFTADLDKISEALFALGISGGSEHCGEAIDIATTGLRWTSSRDDLKLIFIAGNEPFTQGPVKYADAIKRAQDPGIVVSTIHCGSATDNADWRDGAALSGGTFANIDHNARIAHVETPFDQEIAELGVAINGTYLPYGSDGGSGFARQSAQDGNALGTSLGTSARRGISKASSHYSNDAWDLVDATRQKKVDLSKLNEASLPPEMKKMTAAERAAHIEAMQAKRDEIKKKIATLNTKREAFLAEKRQADKNDSSLNAALIDGLKRLAKDKGYTLGGAG